MKKKILTGTIAAAAVIAGAWGILFAVRRTNEKPVRVYKVSEVAQTNYWADQQSTYGMVASDQLQNVFLTSTQTVSKIFVQKGQQVKAGDPLLAYDTTLSQINIEKVENDLNQQKRTLDLARKELVKMQNTKPADERRTVPADVADGNEQDEPEGIDEGEESDPNGSGEETSEGEHTDAGNGESHQSEENAGNDSGRGDVNSEKNEENPKQEERTNHLDTNYCGEPIGEAKTYETPVLLDGIGTKEWPAIWIWGENNKLSDAMLKRLYNETIRARVKEEEKQGTEELTLSGTSSEEPYSTVTESSSAASDAEGNGKEDTENPTESQKETESGSSAGNAGAVYIVLRQYERNNPACRKTAEHGLLLELKGETLDVSLFQPDLLKLRESDSGTDTPSVSETNGSQADKAESGVDTEKDTESGTGAESADAGGNAGESDGREFSDEETWNESADEMNTSTGDDSDDVLSDEVNNASDNTAGNSTENYESMTRKELNQAIGDQKNKIRDQEIVEKLAEIRLRQMKHEISDGIVRSRLSGVVKTVRNPETAYEKNRACVTVSNGGGYKINCPVSELALSGIKEGMKVSVTSTDDGSETEGTVETVSSTPTTESGYGSSNNPNVSYYDCTIRLPDSAEMKENDFVSVSFENGGSSQKGLFLDEMFIRSDDGGSYVYVRGTDGKLTKRYIRTGRDIGDGTMEILKGLSLKDRIAFPYGTDVKDGAKTRNSSTDELYG